MQLLLLEEGGELAKKALFTPRQDAGVVFHELVWKKRASGAGVYLIAVSTEFSSLGKVAG